MVENRKVWVNLACLISLFTLYACRINRTAIVKENTLEETPVLSQEAGGIAGIITVIDSGKPLYKANVVLYDIKSKLVNAAKTDSLGRYFISTIQPGIYSCEVTAPFFYRITIKGVRVAPDSISVVNCGLTSTVLQWPLSEYWWEGRILSRYEYKYMFESRLSPGNIIGCITNLNTGEPLQGVVIRTYDIRSRFMKVHSNSQGEYYIMGLRPGKYHSMSATASFCNSYLTVENIRVAPDSISIVNFQLSPGIRSEQPREWEGAIISKRIGSIAGHVSDLATKRPLLFKVHISLKGTNLWTSTDSLGAYLIQNIIPGIYSVLGRATCYRTTKVEDIKVAPDSMSIVDFSLQLSNNSPEEPCFREKWKGVIIERNNKSIPRK